MLVFALTAAAPVSSAQDTKQQKPAPADRVLFDFEDAGELAAWASAPEGKAGEKVKPKEPPPRLEQSEENVTSGNRSLKITFAGGEWPTIATTEIPDDWLTHQTLRAAVTVSRPALVGFTVMQEKSLPGAGWDEMVSRWTKTVFCHAGKNEVVAALRQPNEYSISTRFGKVVRFEIFMYEPRDGEAIYVDNIRLSAEKEPAASPTRFQVMGTDRSVADALELGKQLKAQWKKPVARTVEQVEADFAQAYEKLRQKNPRAVLAIFRDGEKGYDPAHPDRVYDGWSDAHVNGHGPDGNTEGRSHNSGKAASEEIFMRHRSALMRVDLSSIPKGSEILAAKLVVVRANAKYEDGRNPEKDPNIWVAEPCNRRWVETEVNAYEYAKGKFWREVSGKYYGDDPDFLPLYFVLGPGGGQVSSWDFTDAVKLWTAGKQQNHGFMLHGDSFDYMRAHFRESPEQEKRPAVLVVYVPPRAGV
jgi:hypothetical protein